jgi:hypothetical protein
MNSINLKLAIPPYPLHPAPFTVSLKYHLIIACSHKRGKEGEEGL